MRDKEGRRCITSVWILQLAIREQSLVKVKVLFAHIVIERQHDHLGDLLLWQISWDVDSATTAIWKLADVWRTWLAGPSPRKFTAASPILPSFKHNRITANEELICLNMIKTTELTNCQQLYRYDYVSLN